MSIFSKKFKKDAVAKTVSFVGVSMPLQNNQRLTLHSMVTGVPKSQIVNDQIESWISNQCLPVETCIRLLAESAAASYKMNPKKGIQKFCESVRSELVKKGIEEMYIDSILSQIVQHHGENK